MLFRGEYDFLSNFYECTVTYHGHTFNSAEHAYQSAKAKEYDDFIRIKNAKTPSIAKKMGATVEKVSNWDDVKVSVMSKILDSKFSDSVLAERLMAIDVPIEEENYWGDTFWGTCNGKGQNILGRLLEKKKLELTFF